MKESKFIELLNLYVDQEISPDDAALLEAGIAHEPEGGKIYVQYCRMNRARTVLFECFKSGAAPSGSMLAEAARNADSKISVFPGSVEKRSWSWSYGVGFAAVAACLAFVVVQRNATVPEQSLAGTQVAARQVVNPEMKPLAPIMKQSKPVMVASTIMEETSNLTYRPVFVSRTLGNRDRVAQNEVMLASRQVDLDWMKRVQLEPLRGVSVEELVFENKPVQVQDIRDFGPQRQTQGKIEMGAFQFEK